MLASEASCYTEMRIDISYSSSSRVGKWVWSAFLRGGWDVELSDGSHLIRPSPTR